MRMSILHARRRNACPAGFSLCRFAPLPVLSCSVFDRRWSSPVGNKSPVVCPQSCRITDRWFRISGYWSALCSVLIKCHSPPDCNLGTDYAAWLRELLPGAASVQHNLLTIYRNEYLPMASHSSHSPRYSDLFFFFFFCSGVWSYIFGSIYLFFPNMYYGRLSIWKQFLLRMRWKFIGLIFFFFTTDLPMKYQLLMP